MEHPGVQPNGPLDAEGSDEESGFRALLQADAVIVIGGEEGTASTCAQALEMERTVLPLGSTHAVAEEIFRHLSNTLPYNLPLDIRNSWDMLGNPIAHAADAHRVSAAMLGILGYYFPIRDPYTEFSPAED